MHPGKTRWSRRFEDLRPMLEWKNHLGSVTITFNPALDRYLMCVADGWPSTRTISTLILEANNMAGPWRLVSYLKDFGAQGYFVNLPGKFIQPDGKTMWLCYSANFTNDWLHTQLPDRSARQPLWHVRAGDQTDPITQLGRTFGMKVYSHPRAM